MKYILIAGVLLLGACKKNGGSSSNTPSPYLTIDDLTAQEGNSGTTAFEFRVSLDHAASQAVTVTYSTVDGTAKAGNDFTAATSQTLVLQPGETEKKITVNVIGDDIKEGDEQFTISISALTNALVRKSTATGTITNDDTRVPIATTGYDAPTSYPGYTLTWQDEFNGTTLNSAYWSNQNGDGCPDICGWGNNELEYYTPRPENLFFQDGKLVIEARKENYSGKQYTSSKILTAGKKTFKYGRIDIRAQLPKGKGIWPALWLLPQDNVYGAWPKSGELDLMELVGHEPNKVYGTAHYGPGPGSTSTSRGYTQPTGDFSDQFHVFSLEWKADQVKWYVDGNLYSTLNKADIGALQWPFNESFYLIFNVAVGGYWPGNPDATTYFPQWMVVDYIRVYQ